MDIALYIVAIVAMLALTWLLLRAARSLGEASVVMRHADTVLEDVRKDIGQMTSEISTIRLHLIPVIDSIGDITHRASEVAEGLAPRIDAVYDTIDDALDVAHGVLEDVERLKGEVVETIESPLRVVRKTSNGLSSTLIKGLGVVRDLVKEFKKKD